MSESNLTPAMMILIVIAILAIGAAIWMYMQKKRTQDLRTRFGPEYERAIDTHGERTHAESDLEKREKRVARFKIRSLRDDERAKYSEDWRIEQSLFVDEPRTAVKHADALVQDVMRQRGYPVSDFEQNAADLSVDHPRVVQNYRVAHDIAVRDARGQSSTEDLRKAMVSYRALFEDLLEQRVDTRVEARR